MKRLAATILAFILVLGSIGAYDNGSIGFGQFLIQTSIGILIVCLALHKKTN